MADSHWYHPSKLGFKIRGVVYNIVVRVSYPSLQCDGKKLNDKKWTRSFSVN